MHDNPPFSIKFKRVHPLAQLPSKKHAADAGYDLHCVERVELEPGQICSLRTGLQVMDVPLSHVMLKIEGRSSLASKGVFPAGGVVDSTYRGEIRVILFSSVWYSFAPGDRIAQLVVVPVLYPKMAEARSDEEPTETSRMADGFGSTGQ